MQTRKENRLQNYNYSAPGYYFVTICVQDRLCCLGEIVNGNVILSNLGKIVDQTWKDTPNHYQNVNVDPAYVVMPNHVHGIIVFSPSRADKIRPYTLDTIVGSIKRKASKLIHELGHNNFSWQKSFYDHVIRKNESLDKIRQYITNNPKQWELDELNPKNHTM